LVSAASNWLAGIMTTQCNWRVLYAVQPHYSEPFEQTAVTSERSPQLRWGLCFTGPMKNHPYLSQTLISSAVTEFCS